MVTRALVFAFSGIFGTLSMKMLASTSVSFCFRGSLFIQVFEEHSQSFYLRESLRAVLGWHSQ